MLLLNLTQNNHFYYLVFTELHHVIILVIVKYENYLKTLPHVYPALLLEILIFLTGTIRVMFQVTI